MDYTHYTHDRFRHLESGLSSDKVLRPNGHWYRSHNYVWYTIYQGKRYTYFQGKWYREHADQGMRAQRNVSEGTPLLFSDGTWFVEAGADPCVKELHDGLRPGASINNNNNNIDKNKTVATKKQQMGIRFTGNRYPGAVTPLPSPPSSPLLAPRVLTPPFPSDDFVKIDSDSDSESGASSVITLIPTVLATDTADDMSTYFFSRSPAVGVADEPRNPCHKAQRSEKGQPRKPPSYDDAQRKKDRPRNPSSYDDARRQGDDEELKAIERLVTRENHTFMSTAAALASVVGKRSLSALRLIAPFPLENPYHQPGCTHRSGLDYPERKQLVLTWVEAGKAIDREMAAKRVTTRHRHDMVLKTKTRQDLLRLDEHRCLLEHHRRVCPRPVGRGAQSLVRLMTGYSYPYLTVDEVSQYITRAKKESDEAWKLVKQALWDEQRERHKVVTEQVGSVLYPHKRTHDAWKKHLQYAVERAWY